HAVIVVVVIAATLYFGSRRNYGDGPYAREVADAIPRIEKGTGLKFKRTPKIEVRSKEQVRDFLLKKFNEDTPADELKGEESAYKLLGLLPDSLDLRKFLLAVLTEQVIGYYDPATKVLYIVDGTDDRTVGITVTHELVHALQDQYVAIDSIQGSVDDADRQAAAQSVLEGQAVFESLRLDPNAGPMLKMPGGWDRIRDMIRDGQGGMPVFASAPRAIREGLLFPYLGGADFVRRFVEKRPTKELLQDLPVSTKQILNDAAYFTSDRASRDTPTSVTLPAPNAGTVTYSNSFGEFEARLILVQHLKDEAVARRGAGGIDGDRYVVVKLPQGDALVWASVWDSPVDAADFLDLLADTARRRYELAPQPVMEGATTRTLVVPSRVASRTQTARSARHVTISLLQTNGRPVIVFVDVPAAAGTTLIDASRITLSN
ncbi:MAG: hypothetical protein ABIW79_02995, partial [Gemmatimonas sp.]